jgi:uroporphyrin-III C-methyltransferase/precorrin-2 dehydrogenase/sirohydrochlorin ferrochelatase
VLPLFLRLEGLRVLVVGGGEVAVRKVDELVAAGARVVVVAPVARAPIVERAAEGTIVWHPRPFVAADVDEAWLVVAATDANPVNAAVAEACRARRIFVVTVDDPKHASAYFGAVVRRPPFVIAISSEGAAPGLVRLVREIVEAALPEPAFVERALELRRRWRREGVPMDRRFRELARALRDHLADEPREA